MAASLINMLDDLETRLERTQAELQALREENQRLKQQLALKDAHAQSVPSPESTTAVETETNSEAVLHTAILDEEVPEEQVDNENAPVETAPVETALEEKAESSTTAETAKTPSPHALLNQWYERYPNAFFKGHTKPLKVGIHQELAEREEWPNKLIRRALANYVNLPRYIKAVREGVERVDLDGQSAGKVDKEAALHAAEKRGDKKEKRADKEAARQPKRAQPKPSPAAKKPRVEASKPPEMEKSEPRKPLSMEDKLLDLQQKFKGR